MHGLVLVVVKIARKTTDATMIGYPLWKQQTEIILQFDLDRFYIRWPNNPTALLPYAPEKYCANRQPQSSESIYM